MEVQSILGFNARLILVVYFKGLFNTITTLHLEKDYRLMQTVQRICESFDARELDVQRWVQCKASISDALTKYSSVSHQMLDVITTDGRLTLPQHRDFKLNSETCIW